MPKSVNLRRSRSASGSHSVPPKRSGSPVRSEVAVPASTAKTKNTVPKKQPDRWKAYGYMLLNTLCWSAALIVVKPAYEVTTPFRFLLYRFFLAAVLAIPFLIYYWPKVRKPWSKILGITLIELVGTTIALALLYEGLDRTNVIEASILTSMTPVFITIGGILLLKEKQERHEWLGSGIALLATLLLVIYPVIFGLTEFTQLSLVGNILIIGHGVANIFYFPLAKKYYADVPKLFAAGISFVVGAVSFGILSLIEARSIGAWQQLVAVDLQTPLVWLAFGYMATFGSIIGLTAYIKGQDLIEASEASIFSYLGLPISLLLAYIWLGERLTFIQIGVLCLIVLGVLVAEKRWPGRRRRVLTKVKHPVRSHHRQS